MASLQTTHHKEIDLECGGTGTDATHHRRRLGRSSSDADEGSCYSQFYSTYGDGSFDDPEIGRVSDASGRVSSAAASDYSVDAVGDEGRVVMVRKSDCRICHLSADDEDDDDVIELGCCCKGDLAAAHKHCADTWFKIKGNKTCEICNSIVSNLVGPNETLSTQGTASMSSIATNVATTHSSITTQSQGCINGHRLLNFILACMVFAFVISWLFHFNIPS